MASDAKSHSMDENISLDAVENKLAEILNSLKSLEDNIQDRPEILYWIEQAIAETEIRLAGEQAVMN